MTIPKKIDPNIQAHGRGQKLDSESYDDFEETKLEETKEQFDTAQSKIDEVDLRKPQKTAASSGPTKSQPFMKGVIEPPTQSADNMVSADQSLSGNPKTPNLEKQVQNSYDDTYDEFGPGHRQNTTKIMTSAVVHREDHRN